nr:unnamed protein product [Digitaria exilis]
MQPTTREMQAMAAAGQISLDDLRAAIGGAGGVHDDFLGQMLGGGLPPSAWAELASAVGAKAPEVEGMQHHHHHQQQFGGGGSGGGLYEDDESALLASRLRQHQISGGGAETAKQMVLQQQMADVRNGHHHHMLLQGMGRSTAATGGDGGGGLLLPLSLGSGGSAGGDVQALLKAAAANSAGGGGGGEAAGVFGGAFSGSLQQQQHFQPHPQQTAQMPGQGFGGGGGGGGGAPQPQAGASGGGAAAPPRQRVRARRGQATDPHSIAERLRRERIAERMKALQELVPNANKTDKATMLDEIIDYVKFLQLQGRGGGAPATAGSDGLAVTEQQVAKLMEDDMGTAMQYLQGKGLCLMPVSLASAISSATCHMRPPMAGGLAGVAHHMAAMRLPHGINGGGGGADAAAAVPASPSMSVLTAQSAMANGGAGGADGEGSHSQQQQQHPKDAASVSKP